VNAPTAGGQLPRWAPPAVLTAIVVLLAMVPLAGNPAFYFWDDSEVAFLPTWHAVGKDLLSGTWPTLRPDLWMGGNLAAEAQFGLWSPVNLTAYVLVALLPDLALAAAVVKSGFMVLLALGTYGLARDYGAAPWPTVAVVSALPVAGFTLYYDASMWSAGLLAFSWLPLFWLVARRTVRGELNPGVVFAVGYLLMTSGSPYGALGAFIVVAAVAVDALVCGNRRGLVRLAVVSACVGLVAAVAFLPFALTVDVGWRESQGLYNDRFYVPDLTMLAATSVPSYLPYITSLKGGGSTVPMTYSAWFVVPLLPWLRWRLLSDRAREFAGLGLVLLTYLALTIGPSNLWLFRFPVRFVEYVWLCVLVVLAVLLSRGIRTDRWRGRLLVTVALALGGTYLAVAARPDLLAIHLVGTGVVLTLIGVGAVVLLRLPRAVPALLVAGTGVLLALQIAWFPENRDLGIWYSPSAVDDLEDYADRYEGPVLQVAADWPLPEDPRVLWDDIRFGSLAAAGGVESISGYTGIGYEHFSETLCLIHNGSTCADAFYAAWAPVGDAVPVDRLVDALGVRTVVVLTSTVPEAADQDLPPEWTLSEVDDYVTVFSRTEPLPWPESRLAATTDGVQVDVVSSTRTVEQLRVTTSAEGGALLFSRLAWPGYTATVDGEQVVVESSSEGLLEVSLPADLVDADVVVQFRVPGYPIAIPLLIVGVTVAAVQAVAVRRASSVRPRHGSASGSRVVIPSTHGTQ